MAVISVISNNGKNVTKARNSTISNVKVNGVNCHFAKSNEVTDGVCLDAVNEPIIDMQLSGNSEQDGTPTTETPVEIESVGEKTKNLFNSALWKTSTTNFGLTVQYLKDEDCFVLNGTATSEREYGLKYINIPITKGEVFSLSTKYISGTLTKATSGNNYSVGYFGMSDEPNKYSNWTNVVLSQSDFKRQNQSCNANYITAFWFFISAGVTFDNYKVKIQLEKGTTATDYEPYGYKVPVKVNESITNIYLNEPLRKAGKYADYIDYKNKKVVRNVNIVDLGTLTWTLRNNTTAYFLAGNNQVQFKDEYGNNVFSKDMPNLLCTGLKVDTPSILYNKQSTEPSISNYVLNSYKTISVYYDGFDTVDDFTSAVNGILIYYIMATPTEETIDIPEISTFDGTSIFDVKTTIKPSEVKVNYWKQI